MAIITLALLCGCGGGAGGGSSTVSNVGASTLQASDVTTILTRAVNHALQLGENVAVSMTDRHGRILGEVVMNGAPASAAVTAESRAGLGAAFSSDGEAFTSETIALIIGDHFPPENTNAPAGPLFGTEFSGFTTGDVTAVAHFGDAVTGTLVDIDNPNAVGNSRTPAGNGQVGSVDATIFAATNSVPEAIKGGIPLFRGGQFLGGLGVAGASTADRNLDIALAGYRELEPPVEIRANRVSLNGLLLTFGRDSIADPAPSTVAFGALPVTVIQAPRDAPSELSAFPGGSTATFSGIQGIIKNAIIDSPNNVAGPKSGVTSPLTATDVRTIITNCVQRAKTARAGIRRRPDFTLGAFVVVHVSVVDQNGELLGVFAMDDATVFSYDVSVQKARTCAFFSTNQVAFGVRSIGFYAQPRFPPNLEGPELIDNAAALGPLNGLQAAFTARPIVGIGMDSGFQVFPGGVPLYRGGELIGGVGISGDGVDQDDLVALAGSIGFEAGALRVDTVSATDKSVVVDALVDAVNRITTALDNNTDPSLPAARAQTIRAAAATSLTRLQGADFQTSHNEVDVIPFVRIPRNPDL